MMDVSFGQIYPTESMVHNMDARAKLVITVAYIVMVFFVRSFVVFGVIALCLLVVTLLSRVPVTKVLKSVKFVIYLLVFSFIVTVLLNKGEGEQAELAQYGFYLAFGPFCICGTGLIGGARLVVRLFLLVTGPTLLTLTTTPVALTDAIESLLAPLAKIHLPVHAFAMVTSLALRLVPTLLDETEKIINAQKARGASFDHGNIFKRATALVPVLIPLFLSALSRSDELADAMDSRCYRGAKGRTKMKVMKYGAIDYVAYALMTTLFFFVLLTTYNWWNFGFISIITRF